MRLLVALLALPVIEIALFILVGGWIGLWPTLGLVVVAMIVGVTLLRGLGANAFAQARSGMVQETDPSEKIVRLVMTFFAAMLLILPGFLTDAVAIGLLIPQVQRAAFTGLRRRARMQGMVMGMSMNGTAGPASGYTPGHAPHARPPADRVIDAEFEDLPPAPGTSGNGPRGPSGWTQ